MHVKRNTEKRTATPVVRSLRQFLGLRVGVCVNADVSVCLCARVLSDAPWPAWDP